MSEVSEITSVRCTSCKLSAPYDIERIERTPLQRWISKLVPVKRYWCRRCNTKFVRF